MLSVTMVIVCITARFPSLQRGHDTLVMLNMIVKHQRNFFPSSFYVAIISVYSCVPALFSAAHSTGLHFALGCCLCLDLSHLWRSHWLPWRYW